MQIRNSVEQHRTANQHSALKELYSYSLESHTLKVLQQLADESLVPQDFYQLGKRPNEGVLHRVRQVICTSLSNDHDEFLEMVNELFSESKMQQAGEQKLAAYIRANKELQMEIGRLRIQVVELRQQSAQSSFDPKIKAFEKMEEYAGQFQKQLQSLQKQLEAKTQNEKQLKRELELAQSRCELEQKKHQKRVKEMQELIASSKRQKAHLNGELKGLNELIRRFEAENTDHIKRYNESTEEVRRLRDLLTSEKDSKSVEGLKRSSYELKLRQLQAKLSQAETKAQSVDSLRDELTETKAKVDLLIEKLHTKDYQLKEIQEQYEAHKKGSAQAKRNRQEQDPTYNLSEIKGNQQLERQISTLKQSNREKESAIADLNSQIASLKSTHETRISELQSLNVKLMENVNGESRQLIEHIGKLEQDNTTLVVELKEVVRDYNQSLLDAEEKIMFLSQTIKKYEDELQSIYRIKDALDGELKSKQAEIQAMRRQNEVVLQKLGKEATSTQQQLAQLKLQNNGLMSHFTKTEDRLRKEIESEREKLRESQLKCSKAEKQIKTLEDSIIKHEQLYAESTLRTKQLESEIQRFSILAESLKKKFKRKLQLVLSKIKTSVSRLHEDNRAIRNFVKSQLKSSRSALETQFKDQLSKFQKEFGRYREAIVAECNIKVEQLLKEILLLRKELARRDEEQILRREHQTMKRQILGQLSSQLSSSKSPQRELKRNSSCNNVKQFRGGLDIEARRTGFENLKSQIKHEQHRLMSRIGRSASPQDFD